MPVTLEEPASLPPPPSLSYILYMYSLTIPGRGLSLSQSVSYFTAANTGPLCYNCCMRRRRERRRERRGSWLGQM